ncbi:MAG TPA: hypothetical protein VGI39_33205 [Polyangiaceae bacterium]|jgi:hypothetical protein
MRLSLANKVIASAAAIACTTVLSGCWHTVRREPRHEEREERREERHEERHEEHLERR